MKNCVQRDSVFHFFLEEFFVYVVAMSNVICASFWVEVSDVSFISAGYLILFNENCKGGGMEIKKKY